MSIVDKIIIAIHLNKLVCMDHKAVLVVEIVTNNAMVNYHLALSIKGIETIGDYTIRSGRSNGNSHVLGNISIAFKTTAHATKVVVSINFIDTDLGLTIHNNVMLTLNLIKAISNRLAFVGNAVSTEIIPVSRRIRIILNKPDAGVHIRISAEVVGLSLDLHPHTGIEVRTIAVAGTLGIGSPGTGGAAVLVKDVGDATHSLLTGVQLVIRAGIAVANVGGLPAGLQLAVDGVVQAAVHFEDTGAGIVNFAAAFVHTDELSVDDLVVVAQLLQDGAPIHDRLAGLAVSAALIAGGSQGGFLTQNSQF